MRIRTLLLTPIMAPYRIPVFNALAAHEDVRLRVLYLAETQPNRAWPLYRDEMQYDHRVLPELVRFQWNGTWMHVSRGLLGELKRWQPDVVIIGGWHQLPNLMAFALRRFFGYRVACWAESTARDARTANRIAERVKRWVVVRSDAMIVPGIASLDYVTKLGAPAESVVVAPNAVDNDFFTKYACVDREYRTSQCRYLYVGRLHPSKGIKTLLEAWRQLPCDLGTLALVGDGPMREDVEREIQSDGLYGARLLGHLDREGLAEEYARADVFVFPSLSDPWGLVINEAMAAGLPIITSGAPGAVDDLVQHRVNGLVVPAGDSDALAGALMELSRNTAMRTAMGRASLQRIQSYSPERCALGFVKAIRKCAVERAELAR